MDFPWKTFRQDDVIGLSGAVVRGKVTSHSFFLSFFFLFCLFGLFLLICFVAFL